MKIAADIREKNSLIISELISLGIDVELRHMHVADYLVGEIAIERKTVSDFISSMINKRLTRQLEGMKQYPQQLLIIEGIEEQELYNDKEKNLEGEKQGMHPNAIRGMILSIILDFKTPIIFTKNYHDTAKFFSVLIKKLEKAPSEIGLRAKKKTYNLKEQQQIILEGFPGIGPSTAKKLLSEFKSIKNIINADKEKESGEKLKKFLGKKYENFIKIIEQEYY